MSKEMESAICVLMARAGMSHDEAETLLRRLLASVQPPAQVKLQGKDIED